jgi:hypothetical protein
LQITSLSVKASWEDLFLRRTLEKSTSLRHSQEFTKGFAQSGAGFSIEKSSFDITSCSRLKSRRLEPLSEFDTGACGELLKEAQELMSSEPALGFI